MHIYNLLTLKLDKQVQFVNFLMDLTAGNELISSLISYKQLIYYEHDIIIIIK